LLIKYSSEGIQLWKMFLRGILADYDFKIKIDKSNNIIVGWNPGNSYNDFQAFHIIKLDENGNTNWEKIHDTPNGIDDLQDVCLDDSGNVYVSATVEVEGVNKLVCMRLNSINGSIEWSAYFNSQSQFGETAKQILIDSNKYIIVLGDSFDSSWIVHPILTKLTLQGQVLWSKVLPFSGQSSSLIISDEFVLDKQGNVIIKLFFGMTASSNRSLVKYSTMGDFMWSTSINVNGRSINQTHLLIDSMNQPYIIGGNFSPQDLVYIIKYNSSGISQWLHTDTMTSYSNFTTGSIDAQGKILLLTSAFSNISHTTDYYLTKYSQTSLGYGEGENSVPHFFALHNSYPNPFNPTTTIMYDIPKSSRVRLTVFDILGQEVAKLVDEEKESGAYQAKFDASKLSSGIYFYCLTAGSFSSTKKLLLLK